MYGIYPRLIFFTRIAIVNTQRQGSEDKCIDGTLCNIPLRHLCNTVRNKVFPVPCALHDNVSSAGHYDIYSGCSQLLNA